MGSTGSGGRAPAWFDVLSRASGYPATEHARPVPFSGAAVAIVCRVPPCPGTNNYFFRTSPFFPSEYPVGIFFEASSFTSASFQPRSM